MQGLRGQWENSRGACGGARVPRGGRGVRRVAPAHRPHSPPTRSRSQTESVFGELPASPVMQLGAESSRAPCRSSWRTVSNGSKLVAVLKRLLGGPRGASSGYAAIQALAARWSWLSIAGHATCSPNVGSRARRTSRTRSELLHDGGPLNCVGPGSRQGPVSSWANASPSRWTSAAEIDVRSATLSTTHVRRNFSWSIRRVQSAACAPAPPLLAEPALRCLAGEGEPRVSCLQPLVLLLELPSDSRRFACGGREPVNGLNRQFPQRQCKVRGRRRGVAGVAAVALALGRLLRNVEGDPGPEGTGRDGVSRGVHKGLVGGTGGSLASEGQQVVPSEQRQEVAARYLSL